MPTQDNSSQINDNNKNLLDILQKQTERESKILSNNKEHREITEKIYKLNKDIEKTYRDLDKFSGGMSRQAVTNYENLVKQKSVLDENLKTIDKIISGEIQSNQKIEDILETGIELNRELRNVNDELTKQNVLINLNKGDGDKLIEAIEVLHNKQKALNSAIGDEKKIRGDILDQEKNKNKVLEKTKSILSSTTNIINDTLGAVKSIVKPWAEADDAVGVYARSLGTSAKGQSQLREQVIQTATDTARKYGLTAGELTKLQQGYNTELGRSISLSTTQQKTLAQLNQLMGGETTIKLSTQFSDFGLSIEDTGSRVESLFKQSVKEGVSFEKVVRNVNDNIRIAQSYTFKNGLKGLEQMAVYSAKTNLNMESVAAFAEKLQTVEGAISASANLQVLGGDFANYSNPLSLLYKGLNDIGGLQKDMVSMFSNLGSFNKETGEVEFNPIARGQMSGAAQAMGLNYQDVFKSSQRSVLRNELDKEISTSGIQFDDELKELILNTGQFQKGKAGIMGSNGDFKELKDITNMDRNFLKNIQRTDSENLSDIAMRVRGISEVFIGVEKGRDAEIASGLEKSGMGQGIKNIGTFITESNGILKTLAFVQVAKIISLLLANTAMNIGSMLGGKNILSGKTRNPDVYTRSKNIKNIRNARGGGGSGGGMFGKFGKVSPKMAMGIGAIGSIGGMAIDVANQSMMDNGVYQGGSGMDYGSSIASNAGSYAATGAMLGSFIPGIGTAVGAIVGGIVGGTVGYFGANSRNQERRKGDAMNGLQFMDNINPDNYSASELEQIQTAQKNKNLNSIQNTSLQGKMERLGDWDTLGKSLTNIKSIDSHIIQAETLSIGKGGYGVQAANGGLLQGSAHSNGGMPIHGSNISVEGGEFVVNKKSTAANLELLKQINTNSPIKSIEPLGKILKVSESRKTPSISDRNGFKIEPININVSGTIKLETNGKNVDISNDILNNPVLLKNLTDMISKQIIINSNDAFNKDLFKQKW